jgi:hypothetical protein
VFILAGLFGELGITSLALLRSLTLVRDICSFCGWGALGSRSRGVDNCDALTMGYYMHVRPHFRARGCSPQFSCWPQAHARHGVFRLPSVDMGSLVIFTSG